MGVAYYQPLSQWSKGEYANANQLQDDVAILRSRLGAATPDAGIDKSSAWVMPKVSITDAGDVISRVSGVLDDSSKAEFFFFVANEGLVTVTAAVTPPWGDINRADLDVELLLYDSAGVLAASSNPPPGSLPTLASTLGSSITTTLSPPGLITLQCSLLGLVTR